MAELVTGPSVLELADHRAVGDGHTDLGLQPGDRAGLVRLERLLHLHRLEDDDDVALRALRALLDGDLDDRSLHRAGHGVATGGGPGLLARARLRLPPTRGPAGRDPGPDPAGQAHLETAPAHLDDHGLA